MRFACALPLLCVVAGWSGAALANQTVKPDIADMARWVQSSPDRPDLLEARYADLEKCLTEPVKMPKSVSARLKAVEAEAQSLIRKPDSLEKFDGVAFGAN